jgi:mannosyltransferase OCH1-like enzyme
MDKKRLQYRVAAVLLCQYPLRPVRPLYTDVPRSHARIPNVVWQTWDHDALGRTHAAGIERFRRMNAGWSFRLWSMRECDAFMEEAYRGEPILEIYRRAGIGPLRTDIWRYALLLKEGGVYCDINKMVEAPLDELVAPHDAAVIACERTPLLMPDAADASPLPEPARRLLQHPDYNRLNWCLAFEPGHPFLRRVLERIVETYPSVRGRAFPHVKAAVIEFTGPRMLTRAIADVLVRAPGTPFTQCGFDFHGHGRTNIRYSWSRYLQVPSYKTLRSQVMID